MGSYAAAIERASRAVFGGPGAFGYILILLPVAAALALYFTQGHTNIAIAPNVATGPIGDRPVGFALGEVTGITAAVLLPITVILAARVKPLEYLFGDLSGVYVAHGLVGLAMFVLVSFHPVTYLPGRLLVGNDFVTSADAVVPFVLVPLDWISYLAIATAVIVTLYMKPSFSTWRSVHLLLGFALILTGYSLLFHEAAFDTVQIPALRYLLLALYGLATIAFLWVAIVRRIIEPKHEYRIVDAVHHDVANAIELRGVPVGKPLRFEPGQFTYVDLLDRPAQLHRELEAHPFSIASAPGQSTLSLVVETNGAHTSRMKDITAGDNARALLHGAYGRLVPGGPRRPQAALGGRRHRNHPIYVDGGGHRLASRALRRIRSDAGRGGRSGRAGLRA